MFCSACQRLKKGDISLFWFHSGKKKFWYWAVAFFFGQYAWNVLTFLFFFLYTSFYWLPAYRKGTSVVWNFRNTSKNLWKLIWQFTFLYSFKKTNATGYYHYVPLLFSNLLLADSISTHAHSKTTMSAATCISEGRRFAIFPDRYILLRLVVSLVEKSWPIAKVICADWFLINCCFFHDKIK